MAEKEKVTTMVLNVDLQCHNCYKKVKRVLCKFPQIRDQMYDVKQNQVVIKVVYFSPEKIRDRIRSSSGTAIRSIEIKEPEKPKKQDQPPKPAPEPAPEKPKDPPPKPAPVPVGYPPFYPVTVNVCCTYCYHGHHGGPCKTGPAPAPEKPKETPRNVCCTDCYHGHHGGPCETGYGGIAPYIQYDGCYGRPVYDSYGGGRSNNSNYCVARSDCFSEENPQGCTVM